MVIHPGQFRYYKFFLRLAYAVYAVRAQLGTGLHIPDHAGPVQFQIAGRVVGGFFYRDRCPDRYDGQLCI